MASAAARAGLRLPTAAVLLVLGAVLGAWLESCTRALASSAFSFPWPAAGGSPRRGQVAAFWPTGVPTARRPARDVALRATPLIGNEAPPFTAKAVLDQDFLDVSLAQYRGKYVVLFFYPLDFTFVCPTEIIAFSDRYSEFTKLNTEVLGVSVDSEYAHLAWIQMPRDDGGLGDIEFPLVSDLRKELAEAYGVLGPDGAAFRGLFIIDKEGVVQHATINNMAFGRNVDEVLRVLQAIQHTQSNPDEVCPAGWQPGDKTMTPDEEGKREYLSTL